MAAKPRNNARIRENAASNRQIRPGTSSRRKGVTGEAEVRRILERAGYDVRGLEGRGDWLCLTGSEVSLHIEVKRAERLKLPEWLRQAQDDAAEGALPVVTFRQNRGEWFAALPLASLMEVLS